MLSMYVCVCVFIHILFANRFAVTNSKLLSIIVEYNTIFVTQGVSFDFDYYSPFSMWGPSNSS